MKNALLQSLDYSISDQTESPPVELQKADFKLRNVTVKVCQLLGITSLEIEGRAGRF